MQTMSRAAILRETAFISGILRNEFIYGTSGAETNVNRTLSALIQQEVLEETAVAGEEGETKIGLHRLERERGRDTFDSFLFLIWPFIESYWAACCSLLLLAPPREQQKRPLQGGAGEEGEREILWFAAKDFEKKAQLFGKTLYQQGEIAYLEAINAATLSQAFGRMEELGLVLRKKSGEYLPFETSDSVGTSAGDGTDDRLSLPCSVSRDTDSVKPIPLIAISPEYTPMYVFPPSPSAASSTSSTSPPPSNSTAPLPTQHPDSLPRLWDFLEHLSSFRREGKERRETSPANERIIMRHVLADDSRVVERSWVWVDREGMPVRGKGKGKGGAGRQEEGGARL